MRIRIGAYWLAGNPNVSEREHSSALIQEMPQRLQQEITGLRWPEAQFIDRKNASWDIVFDTTRHFASYDAVRAFIDAYMTAHPWSGTVSLRTMGLATWTETNLAGAIILPPVFIPQGVALRLRYTIRGGKKSAGITSATVGAFDLTTQGGDALTTEDGAHIQKEH